MPLHVNDYVIVPIGLDPKHPIDAPATFVGFGIDYPEKNVRDFDGRDVRHRAVVALSGAPWDIELEPYRLAGDGTPVRWLSSAG